MTQEQVVRALSAFVLFQQSGFQSSLLIPSEIQRGVDRNQRLPISRVEEQVSHNGYIIKLGKSKKNRKLDIDI